MKLRVASFWRDDRAAGAVEFALVAVPLLAIIFGTIEYGRLMWTRQALQESASAGARCIGIRASNCSTSGAYDANKSIDFVRGTAQGWYVMLGNTDVSVSSTATAAQCGGTGTFARVAIEHDYVTPVPEFLIGLSDGTRLSASACFPIQPASP